MCSLTTTGRKLGGAYAELGPLPVLKGYKKVNFWATRDNLSALEVVFFVKVITQAQPSIRAFEGIHATESK
jgi:hypothetical protein